ncbi:MAG TPA: 2OG-Fe(II) oxygenase [Myxococcales bacterium]|nr:2OG-Fe(II) oxygenase [Myxococcales bacterium]
MDQSEFDIVGDLPQAAGRSQALVRVIDGALPDALVAKARRAISRIGGESFRQSYFTTFWLPRGQTPAHAVEEMVLALWKLARPRGCSGAEWWIGRAFTSRLPIEFHFDQDVKGRTHRHPRLSSVFFFNAVRGGHLAVTDQRPGQAAATRLDAVKPRRNRYAIFAGDLLHGVLDARGRTPGRPLPGPRGRLRVTLVVNYWDQRPTGVPRFAEGGAYRALRRGWRRPARRS